MPLLDCTYLQPGSHILVACSGGGDSMALLHLLVERAREMRWRLAVAHLDHRLREESANDALFTRECAAGLGLDCVVEHRDVSRERRTGESPEAAARRIRYDFLHGVRDSRAEGGLIVTGHTADDQLETLAMRLERGTGLRGLRSILPLREDGVVRPLLGARRQDLREWMQERGIDWLEDESNMDDTFRRNRWRRLLTSLPPGRYHKLLEAAAIVTIDAQCLFPVHRRLASWWLDRREGRRLPGEIVLERLPPDVDLGILDQALLETALEDSGADPRSVNNRLRAELIRLWRSGSSTPDSSRGLLQLGERLWAESLTQGLLFARGADPHWERERGDNWKLPIPDQTTAGRARLELQRGGILEASSTEEKIVAELAGGAEVEGVDGRWRAVFDLEKVGEEALVRYAGAGDRMQPMGMDGHKRLADLFVEEGIPRLTRGRLPVVESESEILWVAGVRQAETGKVTLDTKFGVTLEFHTYY